MLVIMPISALGAGVEEEEGEGEERGVGEVGGGVGRRLIR